MAKKIPKTGFSKLYRPQIYSRQFAALSASAIKSYINIIIRSFDKGELIELPFCEIAIPVSRNAWYQGVKELEKSGFIEIIQGHGKVPNKYYISNRWRVKNG